MTVYRSERITRWKASKTEHPPLQPKRLGRIGSFFGERPFMWILSDSPRRFLNFILRAEIWPKNRKILNPDLTPSKTTKWAHISASRMKFKNRLGESESIHMKGLSPKNEPIRPRRLGCRGGCQWFSRCTPCILITSVLSIVVKPPSLFSSQKMGMVGQFVH